MTVTDRDRLAADLRHQLDLMAVPDTYAFIADVLAHYLIAEGWTRLDEDGAEEIAAGAALAERARIRAAVEGLPEECEDDGWLHGEGDCPAVKRAAVLAIIDADA